MEPIMLYLVEDDNFLLEMYAQRFVQSGFNVVSKVNAIEALKGLEGGDRPKILVTDIMMPGMDGFELLEKVNEKELAPGAAIIVLSNLGEDEDIDKAVKLGALGYIVKATSTPSEVVAKVTQIYNDLQAHKSNQK